ncbi:hypothetical protein AGMMS50268_07380 [Spirochaetia bacterium]|nr:hypothetical protein AGMMS50268_07380 [Spirochaetia bacterium]
MDFEYIGTVAGKRIFQYNSIHKCSIEEFENEIQKYDILMVLRKLSDLSTSLYKNGGRFVLYKDKIPVTDDIILSLGLLLIQKYNERKEREITDDEFEILLDEYFYLHSQETIHGINQANEAIIRLAYREFQYQEKLLNSMARTIIIYNELWDKYIGKKSEEMFDETFGLSLDQLCFHSYLFFGPERSFYYGLGDSLITELKNNIEFIIDKETELKYLSWASGIFEQIKNYKDSLNNPLTKYPIINTKIIPEGQLKPVFLLLSRNALYFKLTHGIYFDFIEKYSLGKGNNQFKTDYGIVFQEYIGILLKHYYGTNVYSEIKYKKNKDYIDSTDWFVLIKKKLIIIEVKQSALFLQTKQTGSMIEFEKDTKKTIRKAIDQLERTKEDILSKNFKELSLFNTIESIEKVCIVSDQMYFGNTIMKEINLKATDIHIIDISDFEDMLEIHKNPNDLYDILKFKRENNQYSIMDFKDFIFQRYSQIKNDFKNEYLLNAFDNYFDNLLKKDFKFSNGMSG